MARVKNEQRYHEAKERLLEIGLDLFIQNSFHSVGINQVLAKAKIPKGSFYHYFQSKEDFGLQTLAFYHQRQAAAARLQLESEGLSPYQRLKRLFESMITHFDELEFARGCLMCNLSAEVGDSNGKFRRQLRSHWREMSQVIEQCLSHMDKAEIGLLHLSDKQAADLLLNAWSGALSRMKVEKNSEPLKLFYKTFFRQ